MRKDSICIGLAHRHHNEMKRKESDAIQFTRHLPSV